MENYVSLEEGGGGKKSWELVREFRKILKGKGSWTNTDDDAAVIAMRTAFSSFASPRLRRGSAFDLADKKLVFTTDSFIIDPIFFPGGDIGKISMCGTINDLAVMGAEPLGISLAMVIEEGFPKSELKKIISSIQKVSEETKIPIVTGDTKVSNKGKLDKIEITTSGIGIAQKIIDNRGLKHGDKVISSGKFGEHGMAILAKRFDYKTKIKSDSQPILREIKSVSKYLTSAKDPTRGGLAANLNELAEKGKVKIVLEDERILFKKEVLALTGLLGIDPFVLPSEGRFVATVKGDFAKEAVRKLKKFNREAAIIGEVEKGEGVFLKTKIGSLKPISMPEGRLIPRIC